MTLQNGTEQDVTHTHVTFSTLEVEATPVGEFEVANKKYVDDTAASTATTQITSHEDVVTDGGAAPANLDTRPGTRSILVIWDTVADVSGHGKYEVVMATNSATDIDGYFLFPVETRQSQSNFGVFDGLSTGTVYYFIVRAIDSSGNATVWSATVAGTPASIANEDVGENAIDTLQLAPLSVKNLQLDSAIVDATKFNVKRHYLY